MMWDLMNFPKSRGKDAESEELKRETLDAWSRHLLALFLSVYHGINQIGDLSYKSLIPYIIISDCAKKNYSFYLNGLDDLQLWGYHYFAQSRQSFKKSSYHVIIF